MWWQLCHALEPWYIGSVDDLKQAQYIQDFLYFIVYYKPQLHKNRAQIQDFLLYYSF